jgi:hypothetical protein
MASVLCDEHSQHGGKYTASVQLPIGYPNLGILCQKHNCPNPGKVWLSSDEDSLYRKSKQRTFTVGYFIRIQVQ